MALSPWPQPGSDRDDAVAAAGGRVTPRRSSAKIRAQWARLWCEEFAANAPESVKSESVIRVCAWLFQRSPGVRAQSVRLGGAVALESTFSAATGALSNSGAKSLLSPWRVRRAGAIR